ncbi:MAG: cysteine dioxygenase family protein [Planctomycetes bacterium]|nr:cysteine dioxygenase family protein [Planctomycetota bacterium]
MSAVRVGGTEPGGEPAPIVALQRALAGEFERDPRGPRAAAILGAYARQHVDWRGFAHFAPGCYTRNLVARTEHYELLVLCWQPGVESPIHDHAGQHCWMAVLEGRIEEVHYAWPEPDARGAMRARGSRVFEAGQVAYIDDGIALHLVRPADGRLGVSLHLYARPIERCLAYDAATGAVLPRQLTYHSA